MIFSKRKLLASLFLMPFYHAHACMSFSFKFVSTSEKGGLDVKSDTGLDTYLDNIYGENQWEDIYEGAVVKVPKVSYPVSTVSIGLTKKEEIGQFEKINLYVEEYLPVLDVEKYNANFLPNKYYTDVEKNRSEAFNFREIMHIEKRVIKVASISLSEEVLPYLSMRLKSSETRETKIAAVLIPLNKDNTTKVIRQKTTSFTGRPCRNIYFYKGERPKALKENYYYE